MLLLVVLWGPTPAFRNVWWILVFAVLLAFGVMMLRRETEPRIPSSMTTSHESAGTPPPAHPRAVNVLFRKRLTAWRAAGIIATVTVSVTIIGGLLITLTDPKNFPNMGTGLWWAIQTVTTVGYGDLVPTSATGRLVAAFVMFVGIGFLTVITAAITSTFIEAARRRIEGHATDALSSKRDHIGARLDAIEEGLKNSGAPPA